ncbi:MAG: hypothetical protein QOG34_1389, partial [Frankiaceae bacterium]|nr:hypothetical protein [Frankiaceae bacterium]
MVKGAWAEAIAALDREAGRVGLGTDDDQPAAAAAGTATRTESVWPVLG